MDATHPVRVLLFGNQRLQENAYVDDDDDENYHSDKDYIVSSESGSDNNNDAEEEKLQTPVNPIIENTVTQWENSQWFSSARYDYTQSGAFLDMGSGSPIDDLIESGTLRLLDWNNSILSADDFCG
ncbi:hypothetical protein M9H77_27569 [Catharanthus roseus]|uniref:Uncharacterized protein n=1 Tax=Catharanthus roseus TaxID=4058 RepID=A0ACC0ADW3_CATRO|nr:hypothetical protein M9H77_27569 [Catharanthus roseus]